MARTDREISLRIVIVAPTPGVVFALQRGKDELVSPTVATGEELSFDLTVRVRGEGEPSPNFLGDCVQGPKGGRFVYVNSGTLAGQEDSCWSRRAKIGLQEITWELVDKLDAASTKVLEATIPGRARDGGPSCATVPLLDGGWRIAS